MLTVKKTGFSAPVETKKGDGGLSNNTANRLFILLRIFIHKQLIQMTRLTFQR